MHQTNAKRITEVAPRAGEIVLMGRRPGCVTRVIGAINDRWWVETTVARHALVQGILHDSGRTRIWAVRPWSSDTRGRPGLQARLEWPHRSWSHNMYIALKSTPPAAPDRCGPG